MAKTITIIAIACLLIPLMIVVAGNVNYASGAPAEISLPAINEAELPPEVQAWIEEKIEEPINTTLVHAEKQYILVARGMKPTAGYSIEIIKIEKADGNIVIHTETQDPDPDDMVAEVITYPYDLTVIEYQGLPVRFE